MNTLQIYVTRKGESVETALRLQGVTQMYVHPDANGRTILELTLPDKEKIAFDLSRFDYWVIPEESDA